jgi:cytochrome b561
MPELQTPSLIYDRRTIVLHWVTAALVVSLWALGQSIDWFPKGSPRIVARSTHISLGVLLALVLVARIHWRSGGQAIHLPPAGLGRLDRVATLAHRALYALLIATVALGLVNTWVRGDTIFNLFKIQPFQAYDKGLRESVEDWHALAANALLVLAFLHAAAALLHHVVLKDGVLRRMLPARR